MTTIRRVRADDWARVRELRLCALQDPAAPVAFLDTYAEASARPDLHWQERARDAAAGDSVAQLLAETDAGALVGMVTLLVKRKGESDYTDAVADDDLALVVGVFVHPDHRSAGLIDRLFAAGVEWAEGVGITHLRLHVHADNLRAQAVYRRLGFADHGVRVDLGHGTELEMDRSGA